MPGDIAKSASFSTALKLNEQPTLSRVQETERPRKTDEVQKGQEASSTGGQVLPLAAEKTAKDSKENSVEQAVSDIKDFVQNISRDLEFSVDDQSGRVIVTVLDSETQEVIRQIPPEEAVDLARKLQEQMGTESGGLLFQDNA